MEHDAKRWPFDFHAIYKGDTITPDQCERIIGMSREQKRYALKLVKLAEILEKGLRRIGRKCTVRCLRDGIRVLTDAEAAEHNDAMVHQHLRGARRSVRRQSDVDTSNLSDGQRKQHEKALIRNGMMLQAARLRRIELANEERRAMLLAKKDAG